MNTRFIAAVLVASLVVACGTQEIPAEADGAWVGTITTEGNVTTVVNEAGSVWGGPARLVEELSIGVESGADEYMLGRVIGLYATDDEIFVVDEQVPIVRVFDMEGRHLRDLGGAGQGPGEFERPRFISGAPDGRIFVLDYASRINVYGPGEEVSSWPLGRIQCCLHPMVMAPDGTLWIEGGILNREARRFEEAIWAHGPDGPAEEQFTVPAFEYERWTMRYNGREIEAVPYAPSVLWTIHPHGLLVAGSSDQYRIEILSPDGSKIAIERYWEPVEVTDVERTYAERDTEERYSRNEAGEDAGLEWDGRIPATKPAFRFFLPSHSGELWVLREGPAEPIEDCDPEERMEIPLLNTTRRRPCFERTMIMDVFDADGRYLGEVDGPYLYSVVSFIRGDMVLTPTQDAAGTIVVKRYRLVPPTAGQD